MAELTVGTIVGDRYEVIGALGEGGFGEVVKALDRPTGQVVALKWLKAAADERRFAVETRALAELDHENCVGVLDSGLHDGKPYLVMEFVDGVSLRGWLEEPRSMTERTHIALQLARALQHAHQRGVIHRDFKPDNVLITRGSDGAWTAFVVDFGLAKLVGVSQPDITATGEVIGTPGFMSPEQLRGLSDVGPKTDMYCLGVTMYELFEQVPPFQGRSALEVCMQHLQDEPPTMRNIDGRLARLVTRLIEKNPQRRPSASQAVQQLERLLGLQPLAGVPAVRQSLAAWTYYLLAACVVIAAGGIVWGLHEPSPPPPEPRLPPPPRAVPLVEVIDASVDDAEVDIAAPAGPGCGVALSSGWQVFRVLRGLESQTVEAYVPVGYDPNSRHPLIIALHEGRQKPAGWLDESNIGPLADRLGAVVVAPDGRVPLRGSWKDDVVAKIIAAERIAIESACVDPNRVALLGHGGGSHAGVSASCVGSYRGVVITNENFDKAEPCAPNEPTPILHILVDDYPTPRDCLKQPEENVARHRAMWTQRNRCKQAPTERERAHGVCWYWQCEVPLTVCVAEGGLHWRAGHAERCDGPPSPFDYHDVIFEFLQPLLHPKADVDSPIGRDAGPP